MSAIAAIRFDPLKDVRHLTCRAAPDLANWLAYLEGEEKADLGVVVVTNPVRNHAGRGVSQTRMAPTDSRRKGAERTRTAVSYLTPDPKGSGR